MNAQCSPCAAVPRWWMRLACWWAALIALGCSGGLATQHTDGGIAVVLADGAPRLDAAELERIDRQWRETRTCIGRPLPMRVFVHSSCSGWVDPWGREVVGLYHHDEIEVTRALTALSHEWAHTDWPWHTRVQGPYPGGLWVVMGTPELRGPYASRQEAEAHLGQDRVCGDALDHRWRGEPTWCSGRSE